MARKNNPDNRLRPSLEWQVIKDWSAQPFSVSTIAQIWPAVGYLELGDVWFDVYARFRVEGAHAAALAVTTSETGTGTFADDPAQGTIPDLPCGVGLEVARRFLNIAELFWAFSAYSTENGAPVTTVNIKIMGRRR